MGYIIFANDGEHWFWNSEEVTEAEFNNYTAETGDTDISDEDEIPNAELGAMVKEVL